MLKIKSKQLYRVKITIEKFILDMVLPNRCVRCQREGGIFCDRCKKYISIINPGYVMNDMYGFEKLLVAGLKEGWFERMVRDFKYKGRRDYGEFLAEKLGEVIFSEVKRMKFDDKSSDVERIRLNDGLSGKSGDVPIEASEMMNTKIQEIRKIILVPLPTIRKHIRERGFDHTLRLCFELEEFLQKRLDDFGISVEYQSLLVRKNKTVQVGKEKKERVKQAEKAYGIREGIKIENKTLYILVDDVTTTGSSLAAAKKILQADQVWAAVLMKER
ncbi:MAG: ComF family protein [Candidatus Nanosynbacter sp.]|nr:ComF family protein [Candidatus Nanosynbacter sp.]